MPRVQTSLVLLLFLIKMKFLLFFISKSTPFGYPQNKINQPESKIKPTQIKSNTFSHTLTHLMHARVKLYNLTTTVTYCATATTNPTQINAPNPNTLCNITLNT
eukprot:m.51753 g.51753  ORF g.51753 m.51753 type:complete len:104 (+) comp21494_c0_seq1:1169-1480(+)